MSDERTEKVIGAAIEVHRSLGPEASRAALAKRRSGGEQEPMTVSAYRLLRACEEITHSSS